MFLRVPPEPRRFLHLQTNLCGLLLEPVWVSLILAVHLHLLRPERQAAVTVEVQAVVSADIRPLLLPIAVLRFQELRKARLRPLWSGQKADGQRIKKKYSPFGPQAIGTTSTTVKDNENGTCR